MNIICITIIVCTLLVVICVLLYKYIESTWNPTLYERDDDIYAINCIASRLLSRYKAYELANDKDKYMFNVRADEIVDTLENIIDITKNQYEE